MFIEFIIVFIYIYGTLHTVTVTTMHLKTIVYYFSYRGANY